MHTFWAVILALHMMLSMVVDVVGIQGEKHTVPIFNSDDVTFFYVSIGDLRETLVDTLGAPNDSRSVFEGKFWEYVYYYYYDFGFVRLDPFGLDPVNHEVSNIIITCENVVGPRGVRVGDRYEDVVSRFFVDENLRGTVRNRRGYLYRSPRSGGIWGYFWYDQDGYLDRIVYEYFEYDDGGVFTGGNYTLVFRVVDGVVTEMSIGIILR